MDYKYNEIMKILNKGEKVLLHLPIPREDVESMNFKLLDDFFKLLNRIGTQVKNSCGISISGYDDDRRELFEIEEVNKYVKRMFHRYPYMLYYINREMGHDKWLLSSWADELNAMRRKDQIMNAYEIYDKYGSDAPQFPAHAVFYAGTFDHMINGLIKHGAKIGDREGANQLADYYREMFSGGEIQ